MMENLADVSDIFLFFLLFRGLGKGGRVRCEKGGGVLLFGNSERGGLRGGEVGWCIPMLGECRGQEGGG